MAKYLSNLRFWQRNRSNSAALKNSSESSGRRLKCESLESRLLLAADSLFVPYDINFDGMTNGDDLAVLQGNLDPAGLNDNTYFHGDFNIDGKIDNTDIVIYEEYILNPLPSPTGTYADYNQFAIDNFGAENEELAYATFGDELVFNEEGFGNIPRLNLLLLHLAPIYRQEPISNSARPIAMVG